MKSIIWRLSFVAASLAFAGCKTTSNNASEVSSNLNEGKSTEQFYTDLVRAFDKAGVETTIRSISRDPKELDLLQEAFNKDQLPNDLFSTIVKIKSLNTVNKVSVVFGGIWSLHRDDDKLTIYLKVVSNKYSNPDIKYSDVLSRFIHLTTHFAELKTDLVNFSAFKSNKLMKIPSEDFYNKLLPSLKRIEEKALSMHSKIRGKIIGDIQFLGLKGNPNIDSGIILIDENQVSINHEVYRGDSVEDVTFMVLLNIYEAGYKNLDSFLSEDFDLLKIYNNKGFDNFKFYDGSKAYGYGRR